MSTAWEIADALPTRVLLPRPNPPFVAVCVLKHAREMQVASTLARFHLFWAQLSPLDVCGHGWPRQSKGANRLSHLEHSQPDYFGCPTILVNAAQAVAGHVCVEQWSLASLGAPCDRERYLGLLPPTYFRYRSGVRDFGCCLRVLLPPLVRYGALFGHLLVCQR